MSLKSDLAFFFLLIAVICGFVGRAAKRAGIFFAAFFCRDQSVGSSSDVKFVCIECVCS